MRSRAGARLGPRALWHHQGVRRRLHAAVRADGPRRVRPLDHRQRLEQPVDAPAEPRARWSSSSTTRTARALSMRRRDVDAPHDTWQTRHVSRTGAARRVGARVHVSPLGRRAATATPTPPDASLQRLPRQYARLHLAPPTPALVDTSTTTPLARDYEDDRYAATSLYTYGLHYSLVAIRPRATTSPHGVRTSQHVLSRTPLPGQVAAVPPHAALACSTSAARPAPCSPRQRRDVTIVAPVGGDGYSRAGEFAIYTVYNS